VAIRATHYLGGVISYASRYIPTNASSDGLSPPIRGANPAFSSPELLYQIEQTQPKILMVHPEALSVAQSAAKLARIPPEQIICFDIKGVDNKGHLTLNDIIREGRNSLQVFEERRLKKGEARTKLAFLSFSSGTTGSPKVFPACFYMLFLRFNVIIP
jgi:4-coumarate--CoA ligase